METTKRVKAGIIAGSVIGGAILGALVFAPASGFAQEATSSPTTDAGSDAESTSHGCGAKLEAAAQAIGISVDELRAQLEDGSTIAEVAEANDVAVADVIDAMVAEREARIDQAVEDGDLTEAQATRVKAGLRERVTAIVNGEAPFRGRGGFGPWGHRWHPEADAETESL